MKLSKREKILVILLAFFLIGVAYYQFVFIKQKTKVDELNRQKEELSTTYDNMVIQVNSMEKNKTNIKIYREGIRAKSMKLYPAIYQDRIIVEINKLMDEAKIKGSIGFSEVETKTVAKYFAEAEGEGKEVMAPSLQESAEKIKELNDENKEKKGETKDKSSVNVDGDNIFVEQLQATVTFTGYYENATKFVKLISEYARLLSVPNIALTTIGQDQVTGAIALEFYSIPKFTDEDGKYLEWPYKNAYGKANPFLSNSTITNSVDKDKEANYLIDMAINGKASDLPNISLGKTNDSTRTSYVYFNKNEKAAVEIEVAEENGKYYVKYKTPESSYPANNSGKGVEVNPGEGKIEFAIYSSTRTTAEDKVGVDLKVINNTDSKAVKVTVLNDDKANPRVNIETTGKVEYIVK